MTPRVVSLFSGVGTFDYGFHLAGWKTVFLCEWDAKAREVLNARFPGVPISPDVCQVRGADLPDAECIMFGSPCQDLSIAGKRSGLDGERSGLFREAIRIIREKREATNGRYPAFALWENVVGAFSSNDGRDFASVVWEFLNCGACDVSWRVLDAQFFGVPQRRRRIFLVADFGSERSRTILFESERLRGNPAASRTPGLSPPRTTGTGFKDDGGVIPSAARCQTSSSTRYDAETETLIPSLPVECNWQAGAGVGLSLSVDKTGTLVSSQHPAVMFGAGVNTTGHQGDRVYGSGDVWPTLSAQNANNGGGAGALLLNSAPALHVRRLTPVECERLQGMPDVVKHAIIDVCPVSQHMKNGPINTTNASAEISRAKKQSTAGNAEKIKSSQIASSAELSSQQRLPSSNKPAPLHVLIKSGERVLEIHSQGKLLFSADSVERNIRWPLPVPIESFAQICAGIALTVEKITSSGKAESQASEPHLTLHLNGEQLEKSFGSETTLPVRNATSDLLTIKKHTKLTTLSPSELLSLEQNLLTLFSCVGIATTGFIPSKTLQENGLKIQIESTVGWTFVNGMADSHRYRFMGNGGAAPVLKWIATRMKEVL